MASLLPRGRSGIDWNRHPDLPDELRIYLAGLFDAEGNVTIRHRPAKPGKKQHWSLAAVLSNTDASAMAQLHTAVGVGSLNTYRYNPKIRPILQWTFCGPSAAWFLRQIRPWLRMKDRQADAAFEFSALIVDRKGNVPLSADNLTRRQKLRHELQELNRVGRPAQTITYGQRAESRQWKVPPDLVETLRIYIAGLFDGDGFVTIGWTKRPHSAWRLIAGIGMTDDGAIRAVRAEAHSIGTIHVGRARKTTHKPLTNWQMATNSAVWLLKQIQPWLRIRERQVDVAIRFAALLTNTREHNYNHPTPHNVFARHVLMQQLRSLNQKGRVAA